MLYLFKGCGKCGGDLLMDTDEWSCFQCGRVYYPARTSEEQQLDRLATGESVAIGEDSDRPKVRRSARHLNPLVAATDSPVATRSTWSILIISKLIASTTPGLLPDTYLRPQNSHRPEGTITRNLINHTRPSK